ncbi:hypothetical protein AAMO2058_001137000 [Amorphochlora amoebiformis]
MKENVICVLGVILGYASGFPSDYNRIYGCNPPKVGGVYMGSPAEAIKPSLSLSLKSSGAVKTTYTPQESYIISIGENSKFTYIVDVSAGSFLDEQRDTCNGKRVMPRGTKGIFTLEWHSPPDGAPAVFTVTRAKSYSALQVSTSTILMSKSEDEL